MSSPPQKLGDQFAHLAPLGLGGAFRLHACTATKSSRSVVLVLGVPGGEPDWIAAQLDRVQRIHGCLNSPYIPAANARERIDSTEYMTFDSAATATLDELLRWSGSSQQPRMSYEVSLGLITIVSEAMSAAHAAGDNAPEYCLPTFGAGNLLIADDGHVSLIGFGHDVTSSTGPGPSAVLSGTCQAPEIAAGAAPTPASDVYALFHFIRALLPHVKFPAELIKAHQGSAQWRRELANLHTRASAFNPADRFQSIDEFVGVYQRWWRHLGYEPSAARFIEHLRIKQGERAQQRRLTVAEDGSWFQLTGTPRISLARRRTLMPILRVLAQARVARPGEEVTPETLIAAAWPGQDLVAESGASRVYVAISTLRKLGLGELLCSVGRGYALEKDTPTQQASADALPSS